jgi:hypothetical protein
MIFFGKKTKWLKSIKSDLDHFYEMAKLIGLCENDEIEFWEYVKSYADNRTFNKGR